MGSLAGPGCSLHSKGQVTSPGLRWPLGMSGRESSGPFPRQHVCQSVNAECCLFTARPWQVHVNKRVETVSSEPCDLVEEQNCGEFP